MALFDYNPSIVPDIDFCQKDASVVESQFITNFEKYFSAITKQPVTLARADPRRIFALVIVWQLINQRSIVDSTGKENLLKYAHNGDLDNLGAKWGNRGLRLKATKATTTLRFFLSNAITVDAPINAGTVAQSNSGIRFVSLEDRIIAAGQTTVDVPAEAEDPGAIANGLVAGQINQLVDWNQPYLVNVTNLTQTGGGSDTETDDHLRPRIWMAPESLPTTGPVEGYQVWAASANSDIIDVGVYSGPEVAGQVYVYPLMTGGALPTQAVLDQVYAAVNADRIRPLTDQVFVQAPAQINYVPNVKYWIKTSDGQFSTDIQTKVTNAFNDYILWQRTKIGRDINPSYCDQQLVAAGAKRTDIPGSTTYIFKVVDNRSVAVEVSPTLSYQGLEDE